MLHYGLLHYEQTVPFFLVLAKRREFHERPAEWLNYQLTERRGIDSERSVQPAVSHGVIIIQSDKPRKNAKRLILRF